MTATRIRPKGLAAVLAAIVATAVAAGCGGDPSDADLRKIGGEHAKSTLGVTVSADDITLVRSTREPEWAAVSGASGRRLWVVWLRDREVKVAETEVRRMNPRSVPCDLRPAFSEPDC